MKKAAASGSEIVLYEAADGEVRLDVRLDHDTVWLTQRQMADLFDTSTDNVSLHLKNIFADSELEESATTEDFSVVQSEGNRRVRRQVKHYNLDAIISVGYRVNSRRGVRFRQWATGTLREHLVRGYTIYRQRLEQNARELEAALSFVRKTATSGSLTADQGRGLVDVISRYTQTFLLLQRYDEGSLVEPKGVAGGVLPSVGEARKAIGHLKRDLIARCEASELFGSERQDGLDAILGNLKQSAFGKPAYPTIESKAAHLLYFAIKNHPFADGNKRIGSFLFIDFLHRNRRLIHDGEPVINDVGLAALALLVAESSPKDKELMIRLIMNMLARPSDG